MEENQMINKIVCPYCEISQEGKHHPDCPWATTTDKNIESLEEQMKILKEENTYLALQILELENR